MWRCYILGTWDYIKDTMHDFKVWLVWKAHPDQGRRYGAGHWEYYYKEGPLSHYIAQRRIANEKRIHNKTRQ